MEDRVRCLIVIRGRVQGVGFRPLAYRLATAAQLSGRAWNGPAGLHVELDGEARAVAGVVEALSQRPPPLARVTGVDVSTAPASDLPGDRPEGFVILESAPAGVHATLPAPDVAPCAACEAELLDPADRRFGHAFISCTDCGPRFTIAGTLPYARARTTMAPMSLCTACASEYADPGARRFHAETIACTECGPRLTFASFTTAAAPCASGDAAALSAAVGALSVGHIVALKGVGGFQLACDARDPAAVRRLRERKAREARPLAVLVASLDAARAVAEVSPAAASALSADARPIVLLPMRGQLGHGIAPGLDTLGVMLPASPLHALLASGFGGPLVLTSGNASEEPIVRDDDAAAAQLPSVADALLTHDRTIAHRADDSIVQLIDDQPVVLRRARGFVLDPIALECPRPLIACGADLKNTVCVASGGLAFVSQHLGNLHGPAARAAWQDEVARLLSLLAVTPEAAACDLHPDYASRALAEALGVPLIAVQHHHAHVAACLAEHGVDGPVVALAFDGAGFGPDGTIWGGEVLVATRADYTREARLAPVPMPGGEKAAREPWRMALAHLAAADCDPERCGAPASLAPQLSVLLDAARKGIAGPLTSSAGRLFDAVAAILGVRTMSAYEGQAAMELEACAARAPAAPLPWTTRAGVRPGSPTDIDLAPAVRELVRLRDHGEPVAILARRFHETLAAAACSTLRDVAKRHGIDRAVLTGGCFQNRLLLSSSARILRDAGLSVLHPVRFPPNDGGISLGQAAVAARRIGEA